MPAKRKHPPVAERMPTVKQLKKEKPFQMEIFERYCSLGENRTLPLLASVTGLGLGTLEAWSANFGWFKRSKIYDERVAAQIKYESLDELTEHKKKAIEIAKAQLIEAEKHIVRDPETNKITGWAGKPVSPNWLVEIEKAIELLKREVLEPEPGPGGKLGVAGGKTTAIQININRD